MHPNLEQNHQSREVKRSSTQFLRYLLINPAVSLLGVTRLSTIFFTILHFISISETSTDDSITAYQKALIASGLTSLIRLIQRSRGILFNRSFFGNILLEDSCHYLLYSVIFVNQKPMSVVLFPVTMFALLHLTNLIVQTVNLFTSSAASTTGDDNDDSSSLDSSNNDSADSRMNDNNFNQYINLTLGVYTHIALLSIAVLEIALIPILTFNIYWSHIGALSFLLYYRFITLRYASRRNPYSKLIFHEIWIQLEKFVNKPSCPFAVKFIIEKVVFLISKLSPTSVRTGN